MPSTSAGPTEIVRDSPVPYHRQLKAILLTLIADENLLEGDRLWSEPHVSARFGVSRSVVRQTLAELENEGVVERIKGKGTFLAAAKVDHGLTLSVEGLHAQAKRLGMDLTSLVLQQGIEPASEPIAVCLEMPANALVFVLERIRGVDDLPWSHTTAWIPHERVPGIESTDFSSGSLYELLRGRYGMAFGRARRSIEAVAASEEMAHHLKVEPGVPLLRVSSILYDSHGVPVERFIAHHRGDISRFDVSVGDEAHLAEVHVQRDSVHPAARASL
ncbi:GntR family transcriptional regulator [Actinomycetaceae bacterium L2_0104]